ncbi:MAG: response regulator [Lautropia sp.]
MINAPVPRDEAGSASAAGGPDAATAADGRQYSALYVDDHALNRLVMEGLFESMPNWTLALAQDAQTCLERVADATPDLILLDIHLEGLHGADLMHRVRRLPGLGTLPAIAVSADGQPEDIAAAMRAGFDDYWVKPLDLGRMQHSLARLFADRAAG